MKNNSTIPRNTADWKNFCGIDEAGRGSLAGPLVAASVIIRYPVHQILKALHFTLKDSKLLSASQRETVYRLLCSYQTEIKVEVISALRINHHGIGWANREIIRRLIKLTDAPQYIVDGNLKIGIVHGKKSQIHSVIHADATVFPVICAGIVAKVERDNIMKKLSGIYPGYGWSHNAGYGTAEHLNAILQLGTSRYHRHIFVHTAINNFQNHQTLHGI